MLDPHDIALPPVGRVLGMRIRELDTGRAVVTFEATASLTNLHGDVQGGMVAAMLDATMGPAVRTTLAEGEWAPNVDLQVQHLAPARVGQLTGHGRVRRKGGTIVFVEAELHDASGTLLATSTAAAIVRRPNPATGSEASPR